MNAEAFQKAYLKEIGVQTPISSFLAAADEVEQAKGEVDVVRPVMASTVVYDVVTIETVEDTMSQAVIAVAESAVQPADVQAAVVSETMPDEVVQQAQKIVNIEVAATDLTVLQQQVEACQACELVGSRNQVVFGKGNTNADLVFIGDSPSRDEDVIGSPFVGRGGALFERMLASVALSFDDVYVMNGVKCRPQHGRDPKPMEFAACERWLVSQLDMIQPRLICMLGRVVAQSLLKTEASLSELRAGHFDFRGVPVVVIDHPSYLLRSQKQKYRAWQDLNRLKDLYQKNKSLN